MISAVTYTGMAKYEWQNYEMARGRRTNFGTFKVPDLMEIWYVILDEWHFTCQMSNPLWRWCCNQTTSVNFQEDQCTILTYQQQQSKHVTTQSVKLTALLRVWSKIQCGTVITRSIFSIILTIDTDQLWGGCCDSNIWFTFCLWYRSVVGNIVINETAL